MDNELLEKAYNCYIRFLSNMNYGRYSENYELIKDSIACITEDISDKKFIEYFTSNLTCPIFFPIQIGD